MVQVSLLASTNFRLLNAFRFRRQKASISSMPNSVESTCKQCLTPSAPGLTLPETHSSHLSGSHPQRKRSSSNHPISGAIRYKQFQERVYISLLGAENHSALKFQGRCFKVGAYHFRICLETVHHQENHLIHPVSTDLFIHKRYVLMRS